MAATVASATRPWDGSVMRPPRDAVVDWAWTTPALAISQSTWMAMTRCMTQTSWSKPRRYSRPWSPVKELICDAMGLARRRDAVAPSLVLAGLLLGFCPAAFALDPALDASQYAHTAWR